MNSPFVFHHVGVVTRDLGPSSRLYDRLGYEASPRFDDPLQKVSIVLMQRADSPTIELIVPQGADSPAAGWLKRIKAGPYHTCYEVKDLPAAMQSLRDDGFAALHEPVPAVAFDMRLVVFLWSNEVGLLELLQARPDGQS